VEGHIWWVIFRTARDYYRNLLYKARSSLPDRQAFWRRRVAGSPYSPVRSLRARDLVCRRWVGMTIFLKLFRSRSNSCSEMGRLSALGESRAPWVLWRFPKGLRGYAVCHGLSRSSDNDPPAYGKDQRCPCENCVPDLSCAVPCCWHRWHPPSFQICQQPALRFSAGRIPRSSLGDRTLC